MFVGSIIVFIACFLEALCDRPVAESLAILQIIRRLPRF